MNSGKWGLGPDIVRVEMTKFLVTIHIAHLFKWGWQDTMWFSRTFEWEDQDYECSDRPWPCYFQEHAL